jgi:hypothetical protein
MPSWPVIVLLSFADMQIQAQGKLYEIILNQLCNHSSLVKVCTKIFSFIIGKNSNILSPIYYIFPKCFIGIVFFLPSIL